MDIEFIKRLAEQCGCDNVTYADIHDNKNVYVNGEKIIADGKEVKRTKIK